MTCLKRITFITFFIMASFYNILYNGFHVITYFVMASFYSTVWCIIIKEVYRSFPSVKKNTNGETLETLFWALISFFSLYN